MLKVKKLNGPDSQCNSLTALEKSYCVVLPATPPLPDSNDPTFPFLAPTDPRIVTKVELLFSASFPMGFPSKSDHLQHQAGRP